MKNIRNSKPLSVLITVIAYAIGIYGAILIYNHFTEYGLITRLALADVGATVIIFLFSMLFNNSSMYDPYWSVKPVVIAAFFFYAVRSFELTTVQWIFFFFIFLYGFRLTMNFYRGWPGLIHEDWRYVNFRKQFPSLYWLVSLGGIHIFPTIMVFLGCLPMIPAFSGATPVYPMLGIFGLIVLFSSVLLAFIADEQLRKYKINRKGELKDHGLWRYSRHPNYLGEIMSWWGIFFFGLSYGFEYYWTGMGALLITIMFTFISIPMIEKYLEGKNPRYADYKKSAPMLIPIKLTGKN
jgi:steroid 5-alpha reductase family enzyme